MKIISDRSLVCFLSDLRGLLLYFKGQIPYNMFFISLDSFYFYMRLAFPRQSRELANLMEIIEPFVPLIISPQNLEDVMAAYDNGQTEELAALEAMLAQRSRFVFVNSVMQANMPDWENIIGICRQIRQLKEREV